MGVADDKRTGGRGGDAGSEEPEEPDEDDAERCLDRELEAGKR